MGRAATNTVLEGSFGVTGLVNPIGFSVLHHVYRVTRFAHHSHTIAIQLAGRIWGLVRQASGSRNSNRQQRVRATLSLPNHLSALFHPRSYHIFLNFVSRSPSLHFWYLYLLQ